MQRGDNAFTLGFTDAVDNQLYRRHQGAERISEVSARFTLDAMPGKQMAIDADL
ncbi:TPA: FHIPEP family type III secretion protein, partial [Escherichia coli]